MDFFTVNDGDWTSQNKYPRQVADVNEDGRADIVGFGLWNRGSDAFSTLRER